MVLLSNDDHRSGCRGDGSRGRAVGQGLGLGLGLGGDARGGDAADKA